MLSALASMPSSMPSSMPTQVMARSGEQLQSSLPTPAKRHERVDWDDFEEDRDLLAKLPFDQLLKEIRELPPREASGGAELNLFDTKKQELSPRGLTSSSVLVHVYNLNEAFVRTNKVGMGLLGAFHAGVEIFGWEWSYGVYGVKKSFARVQTRHVYKCSVFLGESEVNHTDFAKILTETFQDFAGDNYDLIGRNCCTFARALVQQLGVKSMPKWVDRLARGLHYGAHYGAKAARLAAHPVKKAAAFGGRVLRMGRSAESEEGTDDDDDLEIDGGDMPGQIAPPSTRGPTVPVAQPAPKPLAQPAQPQRPAHNERPQPAMQGCHQWQGAPVYAQVPQPHLPRHGQVPAAGYAPTVYVAPQPYPVQALHPAPAPRGGFG